MEKLREKDPKDLAGSVLVDNLLGLATGRITAGSPTKTAKAYVEHKEELYRRFEPKKVLLKHRKGGPLKTYWAVLLLHFSTEEAAYIYASDNDGIPLAGGGSHLIPWAEVFASYEPVKTKKRSVSAERKPVLPRSGTRRGGMTVAE